MATKQSIDFFYEKFNEGHSKIDPQFRASTFEYEMETINKVDGMNVRVIIQSSVLILELLIMLVLSLRLSQSERIIKTFL